MQDRYSKTPQQRETPSTKGDCKCKEKDSATQKLINSERKTNCQELDTAAGEVTKWEENYFGLKTLEEKKRCLFIWTEENYQIFRNLEITTGTSLIQFNESIKDSTAGFLKANKTLSDNLKDIVKKVKDLKTKVDDLNRQAGDLKRCKEEDCNKTQWGILTGDWSKCKDPVKDPGNRPSKCDGIKEKFEKLLCIPESLAADAGTLYKAAADVVGIQVFSNVGTLESLQKNLYDSAKTFDKHLQDTMKKGQDETKKMQDEFVKTVQDFAKSKATMYSKRSDFEGYYSTAAFFCCPECGCLKEGDCEQHLHCCKEKICKICDEVKNTFCECPPPETTSSC